MPETAIPPEIPQNEFVIKRFEGGFEISSPHVELDSKEAPLDFVIALEKQPTKVTDGTVIENITIDKESPVIQPLLEQARQLREIPERERPRRLMELLRSNVQFAYSEVVDELAKTKPELAQWVVENTGLNSSSARQLKLSEIISAGHAVCRHLSVAMLVLADEAGLQGAYLSTAPIRDAKYTAHNVVRHDNGEKLFKMSKVGEPIGGHAWVEIRTSQDEWMPVDPSTRLVGDTEEGLVTFREANYRALPGYSLEIEGFPKDVGHLGNQDLWFLPGEARHVGVLQVNSREKLKPIVITFGDAKPEPDDSEQWPKPTEYKGSLSFRISSHEADGGGMTVGIVDVRKKRHDESLGE